MDILKEYPLTDEHGKRYREFGHGCREYAPTDVAVRLPGEAEQVLFHRLRLFAVMLSRSCLSPPFNKAPRKIGVP